MEKKTNEDKINKLQEEHNKMTEESKIKINKLTQENNELTKNLNLLSKIMVD